MSPWLLSFLCLLMVRQTDLQGPVDFRRRWPRVLVFHRCYPRAWSRWTRDRRSSCTGKEGSLLTWLLAQQGASLRGCPKRLRGEEELQGRLHGFFIYFKPIIVCTTQANNQTSLLVIEMWSHQKDHGPSGVTVRVEAGESGCRVSH